MSLIFRLWFAFPIILLVGCASALKPVPPSYVLDRSIDNQVGVGESMSWTITANTISVAKVSWHFDSYKNRTVRTNHPVVKRSLTAEDWQFIRTQFDKIPEAYWDSRVTTKGLFELSHSYQYSLRAISTTTTRNIELDGFTIPALREVAKRLNSVLPKNSLIPFDDADEKYEIQKLNN